MMAVEGKYIFFVLTHSVSCLEDKEKKYLTFLPRSLPRAATESLLHSIILADPAQS